jgi:hypothetical protein
VTGEPIGADATGKPTAFVIDAALHAATVLDKRGSRLEDAVASYWNHAIGASFSPVDLRVGERLLIDCCLVVERGQSLYPTDALLDLLDGTVEDARAAVLSLALTRLQELRGAAVGPAAIQSAVTDASRREELLMALSRKFDDEYRKTIGGIGERIVLANVRTELHDLGHHDLARATRRVSLLSDLLGYDISAPRISGPNRLLEVKSTTQEPSGSVTFYVSRNEIESGAKLRDWFLVVCKVDDLKAQLGKILGWCTIDDLEDLLPQDVPLGSWEQAHITLPLTRLTPGLPRP